MKRTTLSCCTIAMMIALISMICAGCSRSETPRENTPAIKENAQKKTVPTTPPVSAPVVTEDLKKLIEEHQNLFDDLNTRVSLIAEKRKTAPSEIQSELDKLFLKLEDKQTQAATRLTELKATLEEKKDGAIQNVKLAIGEFDEMVRTCESLANKNGQ